MSDIVGVDYRITDNIVSYNGKSNSSRNELLISILKKLKQNTNFLMLFDNKDGVNIQYELLPYVDRYFKKQLFKNRSLYKKNYYGNRIYTDYYVKNYNLNKEFKILKETTLDSKYNPKISLSWNIALSDYRSSNILTPFSYNFLYKIKLKFKEPSINRKFLLSGNFSYKYPSELISFQRQQMLKLLIKKFKSQKNISLGRIPKKKYLKTLKSSQASISPFGWGEICYRDFETFISGAALIKPDMDHLETWPNLYKKQETYIPLSWKMEEWEDNITEILSDEKHLFEVALNGQEAYKKLWTKKGKDAFCERFIKIITTK